MTSRSVLLHSLLPGLFALVCCGSTLAGENSPAPWDKAGAAQYIDQRGETWFKFAGAHRGEGPTTTSCVSCHTLLPFALARPVLRRVSNESQPTKLETTILEQVKRRVANWDQLEEPEYQLYYDFDDDKKKQSRGTESILNALVLSFDDRLAGRQEPNADTKKALANLWSTQITEGEHKGSWEWLNFGTQPWESKDSRYLGAVLAAIAVGTASGNGAVSAQGDSQDRIGSLRSYLTKNLSSQNLHNRVWLLWAEATMNSLLSSQEKEKLIEQILAKQLSSGGWSLGSLGGFARKDVTDQAGTADGYATGLILHVLQIAGLPKDNPQVSKGLAWLRSSQDPTGAWRATSLNKNREPESKDPAKAHIGKFMWDAATSYAVLALCH